MPSSKEYQRQYRLLNRQRVNANNQRWKERNRERVRADARQYYERSKARRKARLSEISRKTRLKTFYGLTPSEFQRLLAQQHGRCPICRIHLVPGVRGNIAVDHDHSTGTLRSLLCRPCNSGIGLLGDDPWCLHRAADYVAAFRAAQSA